MPKLTALSQRSQGYRGDSTHNDRRFLHGHRIGTKKSSNIGAGERWFEDYGGKDAPLDDEGYEAVAALEADGEMEIYIRRLIKAMDLKIIDMGGLHGVVPYHSGTKVSQSFGNLERDLKRGLKRHGKYGPWLKKKAQEDQFDELYNDT